MKLIVAGGRDFEDEIYLRETLKLILTKRCITEIVSGTARGADTMGAQWARENNILVTEFPADWKLYGKGAGHKRNREMGDYADMLVAFWDVKSKGTKGMIDYMKKLKKHVIIKTYNWEDTDDEW